MATPNAGSKKLRSKKQETFARAIAIEGKGLSEAYRAAFDCAKAKASSVNSNAKKLAKNTPVALRIEWLREYGLAQQEGPGRPTEYRQAFCAQATHLAMLGATDKELAEFFSVSEQTLYNWKSAHPEFVEAIKAGKIVTDMDVALSLNKRARGFDFEEDQPIKVKETKYENGRKVSEVERIEIVKVRRTQPPDTGAAIFWLTNRRKASWKQRVSNEHTGEDGGPVQFKSLLDVKRMSDEELEAMIRQEAEKMAASEAGDGAAE
jgi:hypothetical protein